MEAFEPKRTFVAEGLTGTAVWDPRPSKEEKERIVFATMHDAPSQVFMPRSLSSFDVSHTQLCAIVVLSNVFVIKSKICEGAYDLPMIENSW